ncbi:MAG: sugar phosphate isomerase/epimerase family protein [Blautia massiliensis (ex Durand et al. 2017)]|nr:MAG: sugar phosphate isomerase [Subdoligranulum variabile]
MIQTGVQQFMLGSVMNKEEQARATLAAVKAAGYTGIELCGFMIHPTGFMVRMLTRAAGMPTGSGGKLDWHRLVRDSGLEVISLHTDLGSVERDAAAVAAEARSFGTNYAVITGMYRFAYGDAAAWHDLARRLNAAGAALAGQGVQLLYHNHNCELQRVEGERRGYDILLAETDPANVNFEFDSYWFAEGGADVADTMRTLGPRMKLWHINDRGCRLAAGQQAMTPILKTDNMELGTGNLPLAAWADLARANGVQAVVLESHRNWVDKSPVKSLQVSARWLREHL